MTAGDRARADAAEHAADGRARVDAAEHAAGDRARADAAEHAAGDRVRVDAATQPADGYEVVIRDGALGDLAEHVAAVAGGVSCAVITPVGLRDGPGLQTVESLRDAGLRAELLEFDDAETHKTRESWAALTDRMLELTFGRDCCVVAVGGGVTGDVAGFVAATYMRGVPFIQVPTTLLAMIDASVGGKTGVDTAAGKNLVGAFHSPAVVIIDPSVLRTLPEEQFRSGLAEAVKHGAILDAEYFDWIDANSAAVIALDAHALEHLIFRSVQLKAEIVSEDPLERGRRAILNFGHTVGHAIERDNGYRVPHGFAVGVGMCIEAALGEAYGVTSAGTGSRIADLLSRLGLPLHVPFAADPVLAAMTLDKKARAAQPRFVLLRDIGECATDARGDWTHAVSRDTLKDVLERSATTPDPRLTAP